MATNYPGSLDTSSEQPSPLASTEMDDAGFEHDVVHANHSEAILALEAKLGTGSSTAVADSVLTGTGAGVSGWSTSPSLAGLSVDTDTLFVDATNDRVGIGTASPVAQLHLAGSNGREALRLSGAGNGGSTQGAVYMGFHHWSTGTNPSARIGVQENGTGDYDGSLLFQTRNSNADVVPSTRMVIDQDGKVGIGITSPESTLHLNPGTDLTPDANGVGHLMIDGNGYTSFLTMDGTGTWIGGNSASRSMILATDETARLTVTGIGRVGIGTTSPVSDLHVASTDTDFTLQDKDGTKGGSMSAYMRMTDSAGSVQGQVGFAGTGSGFMVVDNYDGAMRVGPQSVDDLYLTTSGSYRIAVKGDGKVGIGINSPSDTLHVNGTFRAPGNVVAMYEFHDNVANRSVTGSTSTTLYTKTITTQGNTRLIMQLVTGQFVKSTSTTNLNIRWSMDGYYLTAGDQYLVTDHIGYGANNFRENLTTTANTGTLSAGNHTLRVFADSYGTHTITMNYQSAQRSSHLYVWEVCV